MTCIFCSLLDSDQIASSDYFFAVWDIDPIQEGHLLVISKRHCMSISELSNMEKLDLINFQSELIEKMELHSEILGITIASNNGKVMDDGTHFHSHLIPRYANDGFWEAINVDLKSFPRDKFESIMKNDL